MRRNEMHAIRNILTVISGFIQLDEGEKALSACRDLDLLLGRGGEEKIPWTGGKYTFSLPNQYKLVIEPLTGSSGDAVYLELSASAHVNGIALPCSVAKELAELLLAHCDLIALKNTQDAKGN